jgi:hypothetical protein
VTVLTRLPLRGPVLASLIWAPWVRPGLRRSTNTEPPARTAEPELGGAATQGGWGWRNGVRTRTVTIGPQPVTVKWTESSIGKRGLRTG